MMTRDELKDAARALGTASAEVGDTYDIVEAFASGYAEANAKFFKDSREIHYEISALNELQSVASNVIEWRVEDARKAFMSWDKIGDALDMSRQAAWRKYRSTEEDD